MRRPMSGRQRQLAQTMTFDSRADTFDQQSAIEENSLEFSVEDFIGDFVADTDRVGVDEDGRGVEVEGNVSSGDSAEGLFIYSILN